MASLLRNRNGGNQRDIVSTQSHNCSDEEKQMKINKPAGSAKKGNSIEVLVIFHLKWWQHKGLVPRFTHQWIPDSDPNKSVIWENHENNKFSGDFKGMQQLKQFVSSPNSDDI